MQLPNPSCPPHQTHPFLARLVVTGLISHLPSLRSFLSLLSPPHPHHLSLSLPLSLHYFPLFPPPTTTFLFNLLLRLSPLSRRHPHLTLSLFSSLLLRSLPDRFTFLSLLKSISSLSSLPSPSQGRQIHVQILRRGFLSDNRVFNSLLTMYSSCFGYMSDAHTLFDECREYSDVVSWNIIVNGYVKAGSVDVARKVFDEMPVRDEVSWSAMVSGYVGNGELDVARGLLERMPGGGNVVAWNSIVAGFAKKGLVGLARKYFDEMPERNLVSWNSMVSGYALNGEMDSARELFDLMEDKDVVSWSCMISGYTQSNHHLEAVQLFNIMLKEGKVKPNEITMVSVLSACAHLSALDQGKWIHAYIDRNRMVLDDDCNLGAALIDMYSKCGEMESALGIFGSLRRKNISSWNALITGLAINGFSSDSIYAFEKMQSSGMKPNDITFVAVLTACTHGGLVEEGRWYFNNMSEIYGVKPELKHYGCIVDMLGRARLLEEAEEFVRRMPMKPDAMIVGALLGACQIHGNVEVAERVRSDFLELSKSEQAGCHFLLSNIYAASDRWTDAHEMKENLKKTGRRKQAGSSYVELDELCKMS